MSRPKVLQITSAGRFPSLRRALLACHRWLGLFVALHLLLIALTGAVIVWHRELDAWLNPDLLRPTPTQRAADLDSVVASGSAATGISPCTLFMPADPITAFRLVCFAEIEGERTVSEAFVAPSNQEALGVRNRNAYGLDRRSIVRTIYKLHAEVLLGPVGRLVVGISGLVLMLMLCSGLYLWWPRSRTAARKAFSIKLTGSGVRALFDLHRVGGAYAALILVCSAVSGLYLSLPEQFEWLVGESLHVSAPPTTAPVGGAMRSLNELAAIAGASFPDGRLTDLEISGERSELVTFSFLVPESPRSIFGTSFVTLDRFGGSVVDMRDVRNASLRQTFLELMFPLHNGEALGLGGRVLVSLSGLVLLLLILSGFLLWRRRRR